MNRLGQNRNLIFNSMLVSLPSLIFLGVGNVSNMSAYFTISFTVVFVYLLLSKDVLTLTAFTFTLLPLINFLKGGFYFYNISTFLLIFIYFLIFIRARSHFHFLFKKKSFVYLFSIFTIYYLLSFFVTGRYNANLRSIDMLLTAGLVPILYNRSKLFQVAFILLGFLATIFAIIISFFGGRYIDKDFLGGAEVGGGNPISYGLPVALFLTIILLSPKNTVESLVAKNKKIIYTCTVLASFFALIVTTSRGSILAFLFCFIATFFQGKKVKEYARYIVLIVFGLITYEISSSYFPEFKVAEEFILGRAQQDDIDLNQYSHNREIMWEMVGNELNNGNYVFLGSGPGTQQDEFGEITNRQNLKGVFDMNYAFHALPLQLIVEIGLGMTLCFYLYVFYLLFKAFSLARNSKFELPLLGLIFWISISLSVSGLDMLSGIAFGFLFVLNEKK